MVVSLNSYLFYKSHVRQPQAIVSENITPGEECWIPVKDWTCHILLIKFKFLVFLLQFPLMLFLISLLFPSVPCKLCILTSFPPKFHLGASIPGLYLQGLFLPGPWLLQLVLCLELFCIILGMIEASDLQSWQFLVFFTANRLTDSRQTKQKQSFYTSK